MASPHEIDVAGWARAHGVSERRARQLAATGKLPARKLGGRWLVADTGSMRRAARAGRPLSERSVWAIADILDGVPPQGLSRSELARAETRAAQAADLAPGDLAARADVHELRAHPGIIESLASDERVVIGGPRAASAHGADLIALSGLALYALRSDIPALVRDYALAPGQGDANVILRGGPRLPGADGRTASAAVAALDLLDAGDERSVRAARALLRKLVSA